MEKEKLASIIHTLRILKTRPIMVLRVDNDVRALREFLGGFSAACIVFGYRYEYEDRCVILESRSWIPQSHGELSQMREKGLSEKEIVQELIEIEIATWEATLNKT